MDRQPWFGRLTADQRAAVLLVTQRGVANFVAWLDEPAETIRLTAEAFRIAPRDLARRLSLRQTVELVRIATDVFEQRLPPLAADEDERRVLVEGVLRFGRGIAFAAATAYAVAAEARGTWDARLEALVVDAVVRGPLPTTSGGQATTTRSSPAPPHWAGTRRCRSAWSSARRPTPSSAAEQLAELRRHGVRTRRPVLAAVQGTRLVVVPGRAGRDPGDPAGDAGAPRGLRPRPRRRRPARRRPDRRARERARGARRAAGRGRAGRTRRAPSPRTTCCPSARWAATRRRTGGWSTPSSRRSTAAGGELLRTLAVLRRGRRCAGGLRARPLRPPQHRAVPAAPDRRDHRPLPHRSA